MFLNKMKEQQEKNATFAASSASHYQTALLTIPTPGTKTDGGGHVGGVAQLHPPHSNQNMLSVPSTGIMTAGESGSLSAWRCISLFSDDQFQIRRSPKAELGPTCLVLNHTFAAMD